ARGVELRDDAGRAGPVSAGLNRRYDRIGIRTGLAAEHGLSEPVAGDRIGEIVAVAADVRRVDQRAAVVLDLGDERVVKTLLRRLIGARGLRECCGQAVRIAGNVD